MLDERDKRIAELEAENAFLRKELDTLKKRFEQLAENCEKLQHQLNELLRHRFGKKSERFVEQPPLPEDENSDDFSEEDEWVLYRRKKKVKNKKDIQKRVVVIPVPDKERQCSCGCQKTVIRYETKELYNYQPAVFEIIEQRREVVACPKGCDNSIITAPAPLQILPKARVTEEFLSFLVVNKLDDRQPLYHLEKQLEERYGIECNRQTMARWMIGLMEPLRPIFNLMKDETISYDVSSCDATTLQVLREPGRAPETKSYVYCMRGGAPGKGVVLYAYNNKLHKIFVQDWYAGFQGYLHVDGDNFFELIGSLSGVELVNCNSHARRKFEPIAKGTKGQGLAKEAMRFFKALYQVERSAKDQGLDWKARYELRQKEAKPILETFKHWLDEAYPTVLPKSPLGNAINYCLKLWPGLTRYLKDGRLEIDNNLTEQQIKPFVIARKNFMFSASMDGADALCLHLSLIRTAKLHGLDPYYYYVKLLKSIPNCQSVEDYERLLPWNVNKEELLKAA
jgi:transposase